MKPPGFLGNSPGMGMGLPDGDTEKEQQRLIGSRPMA